MLDRPKLGASLGIRMSVRSGAVVYDRYGLMTNAGSSTLVELPIDGLTRAIMEAQSIIDGVAALKRKSAGQRASLEQARDERDAAIGELARRSEPAAAEAIVAFLTEPKTDKSLRNRVLLASKSSPAEGLAALVAERAPKAGLPLLVHHRDPGVLPALEALMLEGEKVASQEGYVAVCLAASYGHEAARADVEALFANLEALVQKKWLAPMCEALVSGDSALAWELSGPVRAVLETPPEDRAGRTCHDQVRGQLLAAVARGPNPDARWADLALAALPRPPQHGACRLLVRMAREDAALRDRMLASGSVAHDLLAEAGDARLEPSLLERLQAAQNLEAVVYLRGLFECIGRPPQTVIEDAMTGALERAKMWTRDSMMGLLDTLGPFSSEDAVDRLAKAVEEASLRVEDWETRKDAKRYEAELKARLEALRPTTSTR